MDPVRVVYIAGYGRSGSTVLAAVLGSHPEIVSAGELAAAGDEWFDPARCCSCGRPYAGCEFWRGLLDDPLAAMAAEPSVRATETLSGWLRLGLGALPPDVRFAYRDTQRHIFDYIAARSGRGIVVDGSKTARGAAGRAFALSRVADLDVRLIHLVRDGRRTLESLRRTGYNRAIEGHDVPRRPSTTRACVGWVRSNLMAHAFRSLVGEDRYLRLRFEDLLADPVGHLPRLGRWIGVDMTPVLDRLARGEPFDVGHVTGGNRVRLAGAITVRSDVPHCAPPRLTPGERLQFTLIGAWLNRRYGYSVR